MTARRWASACVGCLLLLLLTACGSSSPTGPSGSVAVAGEQPQPTADNPSPVNDAEATAPPCNTCYPGQPLPPYTPFTPQPGQTVYDGTNCPKPGGCTTLSPGEPIPPSPAGGL